MDGPLLFNLMPKPVRLSGRPLSCNILVLEDRPLLCFSMSFSHPFQRLSDSGKYTIRAENKEGTTMGPACDLDVQKPAEIEYPDDVNINEGEDAVFKCGGPGHHPFKITFDPNHSNLNHQNRPKKVIATIDVVKKNKPLEIGSDVRIIDGDIPDWSLRADSNSVLHLTIDKGTAQNSSSQKL